MFNVIAGVLQKTGLLGVFLLMLLENLVPVIPSELIMSMAGFEAARGVINPILAILAGAGGSILGGVVWYQIGRTLGLERLKRWADEGGRWLTVTPKELVRGQIWFRRWGAAAVCIGRALPGVRAVICIPAGVARMPFWRFLLWSSIGALIWSAMLVVAGYGLKDHYTEVGRWVNPLTDGCLALCIVVYAVRLLRHIRSRKTL